MSAFIAVMTQFIKLGCFRECCVCVWVDTHSRASWGKSASKQRLLVLDLICSSVKLLILINIRTASTLDLSVNNIYPVHLQH